MSLAQKYDLEQHKICQSIGDEQTVVNAGLGNVATLLIFLRLMSNQRILPTTTLTVTAELLKHDQRTSLFSVNERVNARQLLNLMLTTSEPIVALAICQMVREQTARKMSSWYRSLPGYESLKGALANQTGRVRQTVKQTYSGKDLITLGILLSHLPSENLDLLHQTDVVQHEKYFYASTMLVKKGQLLGGYFWGQNGESAIAFDRRYLYVVLGATSSYDREVVLSQLVHQKTTALQNGDSDYATPQLAVRAKEPTITIIGDVYPGEFYTARRQKRNRWDPLVTQGYNYTFEKLQSYLQQTDLNIFNMESALVDDLKDSRLWQLKKFVLGSQPQPTLAAFKRANLNVALMANNHGADYEESGLRESVKYLDQAKMTHIGVGRDIDEATVPLRIKTGQGTLTVFNGYWYNDRNYRQLNVYPLIDKWGVAPITGVLLAKIKKERQDHPQNLIVVSPHWGVDFRDVTTKQRRLAKQLVAAGADMIVGHGAHALQGIEMLDGHPVIYGLGDAFFNSDGEFATYPTALPYGGLLEICWGKPTVGCTLRFIQANNQMTKFQPNWVTAADFEQIIQGLIQKKSDLSEWNINREDKSLQFNLGR